MIFDACEGIESRVCFLVLGKRGQILKIVTLEEMKEYHDANPNRPPTLSENREGR